MVPLNNKLFNDAEYLKCYVESHREIIALLRTLSVKRQQIRILLDNETVIGMSQILEVDTESDELILDSMGTHGQNQSMLAANHLFFDATLNQIPIIFSADSVIEGDYEERPALAIGIPERLIRLQRRELYRVVTSGKNALYCVLPLPPKPGRSNNCMLPLADISGGGVSLIDEHRLLDDSIGKIYTNCRIDLHEMGVVSMVLEVRNSRDVVLSTGKTVRRIGCQFRQIPAVMVDRVERLIIKIEREHNDAMRWSSGQDRLR